MATITQAGTYAATVKTARVEESSKGSTRIYMYFSITDRANTGIGDWFYLTEKAFAITINALRKVFDFNDDFESIAEQLEGKPCSITVVMETDPNGNERARVKWINKEGGGGYKSKPISNETALLRNLTAMAKRIPPPAPRAGGAAPRADSAHRYSATPPSTAQRPARHASPAAQEEEVGETPF